MKHLVILSGKGGTGKTSLAAAFAQLAHDGLSPMRTVLADSDVDAANLELVLNPRKVEENEFFGGVVAIIKDGLCQGCGICEQICRFDAIQERNGVYVIDPIACDGCAACMYQCPENAIVMQPQLAGQWYRSESRYGPLFHAELYPAQENSGKLVTLVKQHARLLGLDAGADLIIVDGPPGIGCPVISAVAGADLALIVTEPSTAGIHDLDRIVQTVSHFRIPAVVVINKADIYPEGVGQISEVCAESDIEIIGRIPYDPLVTEAMLNGEPVTVYRPESSASQAMVAVWQSITLRLDNHGKSEDEY
jgi:MinD superfamily P-loop ATPase